MCFHLEANTNQPNKNICHHLHCHPKKKKKDRSSMGKQRRQRRTKRTKNNSSSSSSNNNNNNTDPSSSSLVHRLRHADAPIRHATLVGLLHTTFTTSTIPSQPLLHAVRDQITDSASLSCSAVAASCLANLLLGGRLPPTATAGWYLLAVRRLQHILSDSSSRMEHTTNTGTNNNTTATTATTEVLEQCAFLLVQLLEQNPLVLEQVDTVDTLHELVLQSMDYPNTTNTNNTINRFHAWMARCLHTVWDDNPTAVAAGTGVLLPRVVQAIVSYSSNNNNNTRTAATTTTETIPPPDLSTLHWTGAALAAYTCGNNTTDPAAAVALQQTSSIPLDACLHVLLSTLPLLSSSSSTTTTELFRAYTAFRSQHDDAQLEASIVAAQAVTQEPARSIAKRHAAAAHDAAQPANTTANDVTMRDGNPTQGEDDDDDDTPMQDNDDDTATAGTIPHKCSGKLIDDRSDKERLWHDVRDTFDDTVLAPLHVALEILVTLTAPDTAVPLPLPVVSSIAQRLVEFHATVATWGHDESAAAAEQPQPCSVRIIPSLVDRMGAVQAKAAMGIGHCWIRLGRDGSSSSLIDGAGWQSLRQVYCWNDAAREHTIAALALALRTTEPASSSSLRGSVVTNTVVSEFVDCLTASAAAPDVQRELVGLLGLCIEGTADRALHQTVVAAWMSVVGDATPAMVLAEMLNGLMDLYGPDDCFPEVFVSLRVLDFCRQCVPRLQRRIHEEVDKKKDTIDPEEVNAWHEAVENTLRFIDYKENLLK